MQIKMWVFTTYQWFGIAIARSIFSQLTTDINNNLMIFMLNV